MDWVIMMLHLLQSCCCVCLHYSATRTAFPIKLRVSVESMHNCTDMFSSFSGTPYNPSGLNKSVGIWKQQDFISKMLGFGFFCCHCFSIRPLQKNKTKTCYCLLILANRPFFLIIAIREAMIWYIITFGLFLLF